MPESLSSSWTSINRQLLPLISYSLAPSRNIRRVIDTSEYSIGSALSELSIVTVTSALPSGARDDVPAKMTSSILPPRRVLALCSPITQVSASTTLDLPEPLGPTTQVMPGSKRRVVGAAKDLKPFSVRLLRCTTCHTTAGSGYLSRKPTNGSPMSDQSATTVSTEPGVSPLRSRSSSRSAPDRGPCATTCTRPSGLLAANPVSPSSRARDLV